MVELQNTVLVAGMGFVLFFASHVLLWRIFGAERCGFGLLAGLWAAGLVASVTLARRHGVDFAVPSVVTCGGMLMAFYFHLYTGMLRSVSLRLLGEMKRGGGDSLQRSEIEVQYHPGDMLEHRLDWLRARGWVARQDQAHRLTRVGRRVLRVRARLASWLLRGPSG